MVHIMATYLNKKHLLLKANEETYITLEVWPNTNVIGSPENI